MQAEIDEACDRLGICFPPRAAFSPRALLHRVQAHIDSQGVGDVDVDLQWGLAGSRSKFLAPEKFRRSTAAKTTPFADAIRNSGRVCTWKHLPRHVDLHLRKVNAGSVIKNLVTADKITIPWVH